MPLFYPLKDIATVEPRQVGEMAGLLDQLQQCGYPVPESWVISSECFRRSIRRLVAREPVFADWPQLLWHASDEGEYGGQYLSERLRRPLLTLPLQLPIAPILEAIETPVVRLLPSLWLGEDCPSAEFVAMIEPPICWAEAGAIEMAVKQLWTEIISVRSLAYWQHWPQRSPDPSSRQYPKAIEIAIVVQAVEPTQLSGTLTVRADGVVIEAVQGLPRAIAESCPDRYDGCLPSTSTFTWQVGYQEQSYQPADISLSDDKLEGCLTVASPPHTAVDVLSLRDEAVLLATAQRLQHWTTAPLKVEWLLPADQTAVLQIAQALWWPLRPVTTQPLPMRPHPLSELSGYPASPGQVIGLALVLKPGDPLPTSANQQIIVAAEVAPEWLPLLKTAAAVVSEKGGLTCHAAVLARELGLPALVGVAAATQQFRTGDPLRLDGDRGLIRRLSAPPVELPDLPSLPQVVEIDAHTQIWLNLSQPDVAETMASLPVAGVGLLRSEWLMLSVLDRQHPYRWLDEGQSDRLLERLVNQLRPIVKAFYPRPVRYRSLDIRSNEFAQLTGAPAVEANPMLGVRGTFSYQQYPAFFRLELAALRRLQAEGYENLHLILPFVRTVEEVQYCQRLLAESGLTQNPAFELWMMAEVPSVLFLLPQFKAVGIQGIAIGTHDLTQLLLGIDRDQALFSKHFDEGHPAVRAAIVQLIQQAQLLDLPCILCGVSPSHHAEFLATLMQQGVTGLSVDASAVTATVRVVQQVEREQVTFYREK